jgi:hypothetical protein
MKTIFNLQKLLNYLDSSSLSYAQYLAASCIKDIFVEEWPKIDL